MSIQFCVSGNLGSGKTTLASMISNKAGFHYLAHKGQNDQHIDEYIEDSYEEPERWAFESRVALLANKVTLLLDALKNNMDVVVDRSVYEYIAVFARYLHDHKQMDDRAFKTYKQVADLIIHPIPSPTALIFCYCPADECERRIENRGLRSFEALYPERYFQELESLFTEWLNFFNVCPVFTLNSLHFDFRDMNIQEDIFEDVSRILANRRVVNGCEQLELHTGWIKQLKCLTLLTRT